jgi:hypothetical protein
MTSPDLQQTYPEVFQSLIYQGNYCPHKADVLLLRSESGEHVLPQTTIDPREDEQEFIDDIEAMTGLTVGPYGGGTFEKALSKHWPEGADAYKIVLPYQRATHFILSRLVRGEWRVTSHYADAQWVDILHLPESEPIDPFSLVTLRRFQFEWALANAQ